MSNTAIIFAQNLCQAAGFELTGDGRLMADDDCVLTVNADSGKITQAEHYKILSWVATHTDSRAKVAIGHAKTLSIDSMGALGLACKAAPNLGGSIQRLVRYFNLVTEHVIYSLDVSGDDAILKLEHLLRHETGNIVSTEAGLASVAHIARQISTEQFDLKAICFSHKPPKDLDVFVDFFDCEVRYEQAFSGVIFHPPTLTIANRIGDEALSNFLIQHLDNELAKLSEPDSLPKQESLKGRILNMLSTTLTDGVPKALDLAAELGMSERTLHRRLADEGETYRELIETTRKSLAESLIKDKHRSLAEIAFLTGFSEQSAFTRAFKRWQGQTPAAFRNMHLS